jgi:hypothetical protein
MHMFAQEALGWRLMADQSTFAFLLLQLLRAVFPCALRADAQRLRWLTMLMRGALSSMRVPGNSPPTLHDFVMPICGLHVNSYIDDDDVAVLRQNKLGRQYEYAASLRIFTELSSGR